MGMICTVEEVKDELDIEPGDSSHDAEIAIRVEAATPVVEDIVGPVVPREFVEYHRAVTGGCVVLRRAPVISVASVSVLGGPVVAVPDGAVDPATGVLRVSVSGDVLVTYTAGYVDPPANIVFGAILIAAQAWKSQRGGGSGGMRAGYMDMSEDMVSTPTGFLIPRQAEAYLKPHEREPLVG